MQTVLSHLKIQVNKNAYIKDPETSELGKKILRESIILMDEIGFESFTFKKLGERISSNESSIYRYFESKHKLLIYLSSWYWSWIEYRLVFATSNINDPLQRLKIAIATVTEKIKDDLSTTHINEAVLNRIIISEYSKTYHSKEIDNENKEGFFLIYQRIINRIAKIIEEVNPNYLYSKSLTSSIVEGALYQHFIQEHLTAITDCNSENSPTDFYIDLILKILK